MRPATETTGEGTQQRDGRGQRAAGRTGQRAAGRTGQRAAGRTGQRAAGRTGQRAAGRTGQRAAGRGSVSLRPRERQSKRRRGGLRHSNPAVRRSSLWLSACTGGHWGNGVADNARFRRNLRGRQ